MSGLSQASLSAQTPDSRKPRPLSGPWVLTTTAGQATGGNLSGLDSDQLVWQETEKKADQKFSWTGIDDIRRNAESASFAYTDATLGPFVLLPEGDRLRGESVALIENRGLAVQSFSVGVLNLPLDRWAGSVFKPPAEPDALLSMIKSLRTGADKPGDQIILANGDRLSGTVTTLVGESIGLQPIGAAKEISMKRADILALSIDPRSIKYDPAEATTWEISLGDGSRLSAKTLLLNAVDGESVISITTRWGAGLNLPLAKVNRIRAIPAGLVDLQNRKPDAVQTVDYVGATPQPRFGSNVRGGPIQIGSRWFDSGIGTQSRTLIAYRLSGSEKRFTAWLGLDQSAGPLANARATVIIDGKTAYDSGPMLSGEPARRVNLDLTGAKLLILSTEFGEGGSVRDWVNWAEPSLLPGTDK
ncbi:MAG: NPCBM/NEW2 domain-containing protein [bacterium]